MLPVETCWPELSETINQQDVILVAPPGAGKSTFLPLKLLTLPIFAKQKIIMLQPRQIAVRSIAQYLAQQLGEPVGQTIGYRMRGEVKVSKGTRLEIVTEGLLTRLLQGDPELNDVGLLIFDEFHERNLHGDFSLALGIDSQQALRPDLRLLIMSATLDVGPISSLVPMARVIESKGQSYPVTSHYLPIPSNEKLENHVFSVLLSVISKHLGDILVFLPGAREISQVASLCRSKLPSQINVVSLFGALTKEQQAMAIAPSKAGQRKIVLATNIAETSLTIDGIKVVIDSGKERQSNFHWQRKIPQLNTVHISKASATQRAGRAGRLSAGDCYRLWSKDAHQRLIAQQPPEILRVDISDFYLEAKLWGSELRQLSLLDEPKPVQLEYAKETLTWLEAIDHTEKLTSRGRELHGFGCHPRLANMLLQGKMMSDACAQLACLTCALLEHKPIEGLAHNVWIGDHIEHLLHHLNHPIWGHAKRWAKKVKVTLTDTQIRGAISELSKLLFAAYPDQLAKHRGKGTVQLVNGTGAKFGGRQESEGVAAQQWFIIPKLMLHGHGDATIRLAFTVSEEVVLEHFDQKLKLLQTCQWSETLQRITCIEQLTLGSIVVSEKNIQKPDPQACVEVVLNHIKQNGLAVFEWKDPIKQFLLRTALANKLGEHTWPDYSDRHLLGSLEDWLAPFLDGVTSLTQLQKLPWMQILKSRLSWERQQELASQFPERIDDATGQSRELVYLNDGTVELQTKMQHLYGWDASPSIAWGSLPVTITLLSPAGRPLQKTQDLAGFWKSSYLDVQKEMKGRYPKHFWPDDPSSAKATHKTKKYM